MRTGFKIGTIVAVALFAQAGIAATTSSYTVSGVMPTDYADGAENSNFFSPPSGVPATAKVTTVSWTTGRYTNGATDQNVRRCYKARYATTYSQCYDISAARTGTTSAFSGVDAKGSFQITYILRGGTYPAFGDGTRNSLTVGYSY